jgi:2-iminobutanoate/2-iminopropanoate deaminase
MASLRIDADNSGTYGTPVEAAAGAHAPVVGTGVYVYRAVVTRVRARACYAFPAESPRPLRPAPMIERETIFAPGAPPAIGPYSHAVRAGGLLFCSGQIPLDPSTGEIVGESHAAQTRQCLENLQAVCEAADASLQQAVRLTIYTTSMGNFAEINEVYATFFAGEEPPARVTVGVSALPKNALVEIDAIVAL